MSERAARTQPAGQKRRLRTTTTLTEEQLSQKRHVDRKAQRALRQRTKSRIQDLEEELAQLRAKSEGQDESLRQEIAILQRRNTWLESRLQQIVEYAAESTSPVQDHSSSNLVPRQAPAAEISDCITVRVGDTYDTPRPTSPDADNCRAEPDETDDGGDAPVSSQPSTPHSTQDPTEVIDAGRRANTHPSSYNHVLMLNEPSPYNEHSAEANMPLDTPAPMQNMILEIDDLQNSTRSHHSGTQSTSAHDLTNVRDFYLDAGSIGAPSNPSEPSIHSPENSTRHYPTNNTHPITQVNTVSSVLCPHLPATCPLDRILLDFLASRRALAESGTPTEFLIGPPQPSMTAMIYPEIATMEHPASRVLVEVLHTFPHVKLPEKLAFMYLMHSTMRWQIHSSKENYERLPHWLRPTAVQITTPHAAWIDNIPWPRVRDMLIEHADEYPFEKFSEMYSHNVNVNWPYDDMDAFRQKIDDNREEMVLNGIFEKHIQRLTNWTVAPAFEKIYPEMIQALRNHN